MLVRAGGSKNGRVSRSPRPDFPLMPSAAPPPGEHRTCVEGCSQDKLDACGASALHSLAFRSAL